LVEELAPQRSLDSTPVFQVVFALQNAPVVPPRLEELVMEPVKRDGLRVRYDLEVHARERGGELGISWLYNRDLFDRCRMEQMARHYVRVLEGVTRDADGAVRRLDLPESPDRDVLDKVQTALLSEPDVLETVVVYRHARGNGRQLVAYVVLVGPFEPARLDNHLHNVVPDLSQPITYVPVTHIPLTSTGEIDKRLLSEVEIIDSELISDVQRQARDLPQIRNCAVIAGDERHGPSHFQVSKLDIANAALGNATEPRTAKFVESPRVIDREPSRPTAKAISHGGQLRNKSRASGHLTAALRRTMVERSSSGIVYATDGSESRQSYTELVCEGERILSGLRRCGLNPGDRVIFQFDSSRDLISALWSCVIGGIVPVPMTVSRTYEGSIREIQSAYGLADTTIVLAGERVFSSMRAVADLSAFENISIKNLEDLRKHEPDHEWFEPQPDDLALLLPTSGSTGAPKFVMLTHANILNMTAALTEMNEWNESDISLNWMPLEHVGGLVMFHIRDVLMGSSQVQVDMRSILESPLSWLDYLDRYRCSVTWAPNFAFALVNDHATDMHRKKWDLSCVRSIINGGEAVVRRTAEKFLGLLHPFGVRPGAMRPAWGMSETSSAATCSDGTSFGDRSRPDGYVDVGRPLPGVSLRIIDSSGSVAHEGQVGRLQIKGATVSPGYFKRPDLNSELYDEEGWFETGDLGFLEEGRLIVTGRAKDVIIINGINYYGAEIEALVEEICDVEPSFTAACAVRTPQIDTDELAIFFATPIQSDDGLSELLRTIRYRVADKTGVTPTYLLPLRKDSIPKTSLGKIQRTQLAKQLLAGMFNDVLEHVDSITNRLRTVPNWFYCPAWHLKKTRITPRMRRSARVIFVDESGLGFRLVEESRRDEHVSVTVARGSGFAKLDRFRYRLDVGRKSSYLELFRSLANDGVNPDEIVHLWSLDGTERERMEDDAGTFNGSSLADMLSLVQALEEYRNELAEIRLFVVSRNTYLVDGDETVVPERSAIPALLKSAEQEFEWLKCRYIDFSTDISEIKTSDLWKEFDATDRDLEIAYRRKGRFVQRLESVELAASPQQIRWKPGGAYLVSGGLGGIGVEVSRYLVRTYGARLLLVGRTELPDRAEWDSPSLPKTVIERIAALRSLELIGGDVVYRAVDVCDESKLKSVINEAEARWEMELTGVLHLAGVFQERSILEETAESVVDMIRPKLLGACILHRLMRERKRGFFLGFSSVNGFFGGFQAGAYSAASKSLESFCVLQHRCGDLPTYCFSWSMWNEIGMSRDYVLKSLSHSRGYHAIQVREGLESLLAVSCQSEPHLLIGLDGMSARVQRYRAKQSPRKRRLYIYFTSFDDGSSGLEMLQRIRAFDRFGTAADCRFVRLSEMPVTESGEVDPRRLAPIIEQVGPRPDEYVAPDTELHRGISQIWRDVLGAQRVGMRDNFFELGGHSLRAIQVIARIKKKFGIDVPVPQLFSAPTVKQMADFVEEKLLEQVEQVSDFEAKRLLDEQPRTNEGQNSN
jgi:acyl-CoA synthetase (AMP-forming)/AMP-acid ligase II/acyl carrier protein/NADP-dependent 3-hydroxy acid dehydrogenase YdfG